MHGFYYMANAGACLTGTVLSGATYQYQGLEICLATSAALVAGAALLSLALPRGERAVVQPSAANPAEA